jgi:hypothetical protein
MSIITEIFPQCDVCDTTFPDERFKTAGLCRENMKSGGWKKHQGLDYCPDCADRLINENEKPETCKHGVAFSAPGGCYACSEESDK